MYQFLAYYNIDYNIIITTVIKFYIPSDCSYYGYFPIIFVFIMLMVAIL